MSATFLIVEVLAGKPSRTANAGVLSLFKCRPSISTCRNSVPSMTVWVSLCIGGSPFDVILWYFTFPSSV